MNDFKPLQAVLLALGVTMSDKVVKLVIEAYELYKSKGEQLTLEEILKLKE